MCRCPREIESIKLFGEESAGSQTHLDRGREEARINTEQISPRARDAPRKSFANIFAR